MTRLLKQEGTVHHGKRLRDHRRTAAPRTVGGLQGLVEDGQDGRVVVPPCEEIDAAPVGVALDGGQPARTDHVFLRRAPHLQVELAAHRQDRIANGLRFEAAQRHPGQEMQVGPINPAARGLLVNARHDEALEEGFDLPPVRHKPGGEPLEQLGVVRPGTGGAEVAGRSGQPFPEEVRPHAIDLHAGHQGGGP